MALITLTSDYGLVDPYLAILKGGLIQWAPQARLVDISHSIDPRDLMGGAFVLRNSFMHFPKGSVHLFLVNEVPDNRRWVAARFKEHYFVMADNGAFGLLNSHFDPDIIVDISPNDRTDLMFPARSILIPAAAELANGADIRSLGAELDGLDTRSNQRPIVRNENEIVGIIIYIDNFGNLVTNISKSFIEETFGDNDYEILMARNPLELKKVHKNYTESSRGSIIALFNSFGLLEIAAPGSSGKTFNGANTLLSLKLMDHITLRLK